MSAKTSMLFGLSVHWTPPGVIGGSCRPPPGLDLTVKFLAAVCLCLTVLSSVCRADSHTFVSVAPEPTNHAWWLRAEYNPFGKTVRGIPIKLISKHWCYANEFTADLISAEYMRGVWPELSFSVTSRFGHGRKKTALVGAFETCAGKKGIFLLILERRKNAKIVRFLEQYQFQKSFAALRLTPKDTLELWWCSDCDNSQELAWDAKRKKFVWRLEEIGANEAQPNNDQQGTDQNSPQWRSH